MIIPTELGRIIPYKPIWYNLSLPDLSLKPLKPTLPSPRVNHPPHWRPGRSKLDHRVERGFAMLALETLEVDQKKPTNGWKAPKKWKFWKMSGVVVTLFDIFCSILVMLQRQWLLCWWEWHQMIATKKVCENELIGYNLCKQTCTGPTSFSILAEKISTGEWMVVKIVELNQSAINHWQNHPFKGKHTNHPPHIEYV